MVLYYLLLASCLYLWYSSIFFWLTAYPYGTALHFTGTLSILMVLYYLLLDPCQELWYSTALYCIPVYPYCSLLSSTGSLPIHMILFYLLLAPCLYLWYLLLASCLYLWYSTIFYWRTACTFGTLLSSTGSMPIPMFLYFLLLTEKVCKRYLLGPY